MSLISKSDETDLLTALHEGLHELPPWSTFLARLRQRFRADTARLVLAPEGAPKTDALEILSRRRSSQVTSSIPPTEPATIEMITASRMRPQRVYSAAELAEQGRAMTSDASAGIDANMRLVRIIAGDLNAWLVIARGDEDFGGGVSAVLGALAPHFAIALRNHLEIERARLREMAAALPLRRLGHGWLVLNAGGQVIESDGRAERLLRRGTALYLAADGRLLAASAKANRLLTNAIAGLAADRLAPPEAIALSSETRVDLLLQPLDDRAAATATGAAVIAYVREENRDTADCSRQLSALYALAPREARLAIALAQGHGIADAAARLGLAVETARNYSKSIYAKTGAAGQAELTRIILTSVAALA